MFNLPGNAEESRSQSNKTERKSLCNIARQTSRYDCDWNQCEKDLFAPRQKFNDQKCQAPLVPVCNTGTGWCLTLFGACSLTRIGIETSRRIRNHCRPNGGNHPRGHVRTGLTPRAVCMRLRAYRGGYERGHAAAPCSTL